MLDYYPDEKTLKNDKRKVAILISIIVFIVILIALFIVLVILDFNREDKKSKISTTTRRTVNVEYSDEEDDGENDDDIEDVEETTTTVTTTSTSKASTNSGGTTKSVATTKVITSTSIKVQDILPPSVEHEIVTDKSTYPDSLDSWEWEIVSLINSERKNNGLNELSVAKDLRQLAEEAADLWLGSGSDVVKEYLTGHSNYRKYTNFDDVTAASLYKDTIAATKVTSNAALRYLGVGVIHKNDTYYYVIIYE